MGGLQGRIDARSVDFRRGAVRVDVVEWHGVDRVPTGRCVVNRQPGCRLNRKATMIGREVSQRTRIVEQSLRGAGVRGEVRVLPVSVRTAASAAQELRCQVGAIANSLVFMCDGEPLLVMTSGAHRVDTVALAGRIGKSAIRRATPQEVRTATGQTIGGVAPVGHPRPLRTLVDRSLAEFDVLWAAAGAPEAVFPTTFDELMAMTAGTSIDVR